MSPVHITDAESVILDVLWRCGPLPPARLMDEVRAARPWGAATIKTLLARLKQKKAVCSQREDGVLRYRALVDRAAYVEGQVSALVDRLFGGDAAALIALLAARDKRG